MREVVESECALFLLEMGDVRGDHIQRLAECLTKIVKEVVDQSMCINDDVSMPYITVPGEGVPLYKRYSVIPGDCSDIADCYELFFGKVHAPVLEYGNARGGLSPFFIR